MRLIDVSEVVLDYSGLAHINPYDFQGIAKYFSKQIASMPTVEVPQWISCRERLPEKYGNYLVTTDDGEVDIGSCDPENKDRQDHFWSGCDADGFFWYGENIVIAWMPLPEGYRGEQNEIDNCYQID